MAHIGHTPAGKNLESWLLFLTAIFSLPIVLSAAAVFGITMSEEVWVIHGLIGVSVLLACGTFSIRIATIFPSYAGYAVVFFVLAAGLWQLQQYPATEMLGHIISVGISTFATMITWHVLMRF